jgi:glutamate N-acetyltransferase / amino-acid N-acetyltransferase
MHLPKGFRFAGVSAAIKTRPNTRDVTLIVLDKPGCGAGVYTTNQVVAAPVVLSRTRTPNSAIRALVVNSGNANACTGAQGMADAQEMTQLAAAAISDCSAEQVVVMSTGVIGRFLPMAKIRDGIARAAAELTWSEASYLNAVDGIMTTDAFRKTADRSIAMSNGQKYSVAGMTKGAGMIGPKMATLLGCLITDAPLNADQAQRMLKHAVDRSFNCITVEGHMSTNDSIVLLSSGSSLAKDSLSGADETHFRDQLTEICIELAKQIPDDGEGATHLIEIHIRGAASDEDANQIARSVALSNLVKTAITGGDPNWGRIVSAAGYAGVPIQPDKMALRLNGLELFDRGEPLPFSAKEVSESIKGRKLTVIELAVGNGTGTATHWTTDLNAEYVRFNSEYTT